MIRTLLIYAAVLCFTVAAKAELSGYCQQSLSQFVAEFKQNQNSYNDGKLSMDDFDTARMQLILSIDQAGSDCAQEYPEDSQEKIKIEFKERYSLAISGSK